MPSKKSFHVRRLNTRDLFKVVGGGSTPPLSQVCHQQEGTTSCPCVGTLPPPPKPIQKPKLPVQALQQCGPTLFGTPTTCQEEG